MVSKSQLLVWLHISVRRNSLEAGKKEVFKLQLIAFNPRRSQVMQTITGRFTHPTTFALAVVLFAFMVLATPSPSRAGTHKPGVATTSRVSKVDRTEARIKELHAKLEITPAQEELWSKVTQVMRDNAKEMQALIKERSAKAGTMTAVNDLESYGAIVEAHADGIKKFISVFEPLYASMSDTQKKNADKLFQHHDHRRSKAKGK
jgi:hypothetical protein